MQNWFSKKFYNINRNSTKEVMISYFSEGYFEACAEVKYILKNSNNKNDKKYKNDKSKNDDDFNDYDSTDDDNINDYDSTDEKLINL
jgi:hypothetical protein